MSPMKNGNYGACYVGERDLVLDMDIFVCMYLCWGRMEYGRLYTSSHFMLLLSPFVMEASFLGFVNVRVVKCNLKVA
jgi:hypothetical protein